MGVWDAILLGIVEGLTEFIPVSSTFHLIVAARIFGVGEGEFVKLFEVFIQSGAILAVLLLFWKRLRKNPALVTKTLVAFLPTVGLGVLAYRTIKSVFFDSYNWMIGIFILVGFVFLIFERLVKKGKFSPRKALAELTYRDAVLVGLAQSLAFFPGVSRAGAVILVMMVLGFRRDEAAAFSFFLAIPTILAAGAYDLFKTRDLLFQSVSYIPILVVGFLAAFAVAALALKWLIRYLQNHTLNLFGFYRIAAGVLLLLAVLFL
ncbi:MAG: undecaprenyl-diphosphate phosphatase [Candidatus Aminicenantales bacterium]